MSWVNKKQTIEDVLIGLDYVEIPDLLESDETAQPFLSKGYYFRVSSIQGVNQMGCGLNKFLRVELHLTYLPTDSKSYDETIDSILEVMNSIKHLHDGYFSDASFDRVDTENSYYYEAILFITVQSED